MPLVSETAESEILCDDNNAKTKQYAALGRFIATYSFLLLALWEEESLSVPESQKIGGTGDVVSIKLNGLRTDQLPEDSPLGFSCIGPVIQIVVRRKSNPVEKKSAWIFRPHNKPGKKTDTLGGIKADLSKRMIRTLSPFVQFHFDIFNYNPKIDNTIDGNSLKDPDPETTFLLERHSIASSLADYFQKKNEWWLNIYWYLVAAASLLLTFTIYAFWLDKYGIFILTANVLYTGLGLLLLGIYLYHKRMGYYSRHHSYRTVAEGLRIQIFWRLAGIQATVSDYYLGYQIGKLDWLRIAFRIMILPMICEKKETAQFGGVKKFWVDDQIDYFRKKIKTKKKSADQWDIEFSLKTRILLFAVAIWVIVKIWSSQIANILPCGGIFYFSLFAIFLAFLSIYLVLRMTYCKLKSYRSDEQRYSRLLPIFERAKKYLDSETSSIALKRRVLLDLGKEALDENADWLLLKQDVEMLQ